MEGSYWEFLLTMEGTGTSPCTLRFLVLERPTQPLSASVFDCGAQGVPFEQVDGGVETVSLTRGYNRFP